MAGIWLASRTPSWIAALLAMAAIALFSVRRPWSVCAAALLLTAAIGAGRFAVMSTPASDDVSRFAAPGLQTVQGTVVSAVETRAWGTTCQLAVTSVTGPDRVARPRSGVLAASLAGTSTTPALHYGDHVEAQGWIERPTAARNPGGFDYAAYLAHRHVFATLTVRRAGQWRRIAAAPAASLIARLPMRIRESAADTLSRVLPPAEAALSRGALIGDKADIPGPLYDDFAATGTVHLLATAGLHVGFLLALLGALFRWILPVRFPKAAILLGALILYVVMAGTRPAVARAGLVAGIYLAAGLVRREPDASSAIGAAAIFLVIADPGYLFDPGFQLSFLTVATIMAAMPLVEPLLSGRLALGRNALPARALRWALAMFALSAAAQLGSLPLTAEYFNQISLAGVVANFLAVPSLFIIMASGAAVWVVHFIAWPAARLLASSVLSPTLAYLIGVIHWAAHVPLGVLNVPSPGWPAIWLYYILLFLTLYKLRTLQLTRTATP